MSSEDDTAGRSGSVNHDAIQHNLGLILGQLGHLSHLPDKIDRLNREIGELKARLDIVSTLTDANTREIKNNTDSRNNHDGSDEQKRISISYGFSVISILISLALLVMTVITRFSSTPAP
jgi:hypothetical protein